MEFISVLRFRKDKKVGKHRLYLLTLQNLLITIITFIASAIVVKALILP